MSKKLSFIIFILFISHCSLDTKSGFWNSTEVKKIKNKKEEKQLFKKVEVLNFEINKDLEIDIESSKFTKNSFKNNLTNNNGRINYQKSFLIKIILFFFQTKEVFLSLMINQN